MTIRLWTQRGHISRLDWRDPRISRVFSMYHSTSTIMQSQSSNGFLFINKHPSSCALSHSRKDENSNIQSHVQCKRYMDQRAKKQARSRSPTDSSSISGCKQSGTSQPQTRMGSNSLPLDSQPGISKVDPFCCTTVRIDQEEHRLLQYPLYTLIHIHFAAEAMSLQPSQMSFDCFRHRQAITNRLKRCLSDELTLYTTLAFCASIMHWSLGKRAIPDRPSEFYNLKAIGVLKNHLANPGTAPHSWLMLSIYALGVSSMWTRDYEAST